jgi:hypothetical protein
MPKLRIIPVTVPSRPTSGASGIVVSRIVRPRLKRFSFQFAERSIASLNDRPRCVSAYASARHKVARRDAHVCRRIEVAALHLREHLIYIRRGASRLVTRDENEPLQHHPERHDGEDEQRSHDGAAFVEKSEYWVGSGLAVEKIRLA